MKKSAFCFLLWTVALAANCQNYYYVFFTDKNNTAFNPYEYFDAKAVERRMLQGISLYDSSDFPVNEHYINQIADLSQEYVGESRWFNMAMIAASDENIALIRHLPFVKQITALSDNLEMRLAQYQEFDIDSFLEETANELTLSNQLLSLQGDYFVKNNINGKGLRIAVFDGGFPSVNTHKCFKHLRDNNQIINTWNFPNKKENVYGWNSHGTMVLSCIAGIKNNVMLGLATGADFLLARTEVNTEPKKEEFWWLQAVEWADKNGADVINSSLGYGIDRYDYADMDGKKSLVSRAANMAAAKGMLVCNSAGNEGSDKKWLKIITPADADSVLTVGGINPSLTNFSRISFSSYGPTADGRMKPNVVAFGSVTAAKPSKNTNVTAYSTVQGTSFSSPLTAGFAACAWQTNRNLTAMELKSEIEKSASLYPYFDYAYGYGVPQASYFTEKQKPEVEKTFELIISDTAIIITPLIEKLDFLKRPYLFYNIQNEDGTLYYYTQINLYDYYTGRAKTSTEINVVLEKHRAELNNKTLNIFLNGYSETHKIENYDNAHKSLNKYFPYRCNSNSFYVDVANQKPSKWGYKAKHFMTGYVAYSMFLPKKDFDFSPLPPFYNYAKSYAFDIGFRYKYNVCKWYAVGGNLEVNIKNISIEAGYVNYSLLPFYNLFYRPKSNTTTMYQLNLEFFQRFNLASTSLGNIYIDLGGYGGISGLGKNEIIWKEKESKIKAIYKIRDPYFDFAVKARLGYGILAVFAQYTLTPQGYFADPNYSRRFMVFSPYSLGVELSINY